MKLPPNIDAPEVRVVIQKFQNDLNRELLAATRQLRRRDANAVMMVGLLELALNHFAVWHSAQDLDFNEEDFLALVRERTKKAKAFARDVRRAARGHGRVQ